MSFLDFLFPKRCIRCKTFGSYLCSNCFTGITFTDSMVCTVCQKQAMGGLTHPVCKTRYAIDGVFPSLVYKGVVKKLVYVFKYPPYLTDLQSTLIDLFYEGIIQKEQFVSLLSDPAVFIPIPLHASKLRKRGYNQSALLAEGLAKRFGISVIDCLKRVKHTGTQIGLSKDDRKKNISDAFRLTFATDDLMQKTKHVFLIDDVVTSGATLCEAARVLKKGGAKHVWGLTFAHGE
jgi:ComF family protein